MAYFPKIGDKLRFKVDHNLLRVYIVSEIKGQYGCEHGPESLVELVYSDPAIFDPMWITVEVLNMMIDNNLLIEEI
jgi:hypothetical protein